MVANVKNISLLLTFVRIKVCLKYYPNDHKIVRPQLNIFKIILYTDECKKKGQICARDLDPNKDCCESGSYCKMSHHTPGYGFCASIDGMFQRFKCYRWKMRFI